MNLPICPFCGNENIKHLDYGFYCDECDTEFNENDLSPEDDYFLHNPNTTKIDPLEEKIWDYITNSAKKRFDYVNYCKNMSGYNADNVPDNILWEIIQRSAADIEKEEIIAFIFAQLVSIGVMFPVDDLSNFVDMRIKDFGLEIFVTKFATNSLNNGLSANEILLNVKQLLT